MYILGTSNTGSQTVLTGGTIDLGITRRRYSNKNCCGTEAFENNGTSVRLSQSGIYHFTATFVGSGTEAGDVSIQAYNRGVAIPQDISTQTITTADTEVRTFVIDDYILVDTACVLGRTAVTPAIISFINTGVGATITLAKLNVDKVL